MRIDKKKISPEIIKDKELEIGRFYKFEREALSSKEETDKELQA